MRVAASTRVLASNLAHASTFLDPTAPPAIVPPGTVSLGCPWRPTPQPKNSTPCIQPSTGTVGLGCLIGPLAFNACTNTAQPTALLRACAATFFLMLAGYIIMLASQGVAGLLLATFVRALGSSSMWVRAVRQGVKENPQPLP